MVSERDNENTLKTLENQTTDESQTKETATNFSVVVAAAINARMSAAMDKWLSQLQKTSENKFPSFLQLSAPPNQPHAPPPELHAPVFHPQTTSAIPSAQPFSSSAAYIAPHAPIYVLSPNSDRPPMLLPSNLYVQPPTNPSYHPDVKNSQIHSTFEVGESSAHSNRNVQASLRIA